jgi:hypothetical protein
MAKAYFGNAVLDNISVNINNAITPTTLVQRASSSGAGGLQTIAMTAAPFNIKANPAKGVFGVGSSNRVTIQFETLRDAPNQFDVTVTNVSGQDLYFYVFENTLVGQNDVGTSVGIKIEMLETVLKPIQGAGAG